MDTDKLNHQPYTSSQPAPYQPAAPQMNKEEIEKIKKKLDQLKEKVEKFQKKLVEKFDQYIIGIALLPPPRDIPRDMLEKLPAQEKKLYEEDKKKVNLLVLVDDSDVKKMSKMELIDRLTQIANKMAEEVDKDFKPQVMLMDELRENCFDAKYDILQLIAYSAPFYDPRDVLKAIKIAEVHKHMVLKKFEKYVVSYVAVGSLFRGDGRGNDIDVAVVIDDTDVKKMSRYELRDKLGAIIRTMGFDASDMTKVTKSFHIQVYILTDFWESIKEANPVIFTFLRDGVPLYDRGVFMPWKLLLNMGRIKPSPEAIDMLMDVGDRLLQRAKGKLMSVIGEDLYYATMNPAQAALMLYGLPPATHRETIKLLDEVLVKREKLLDKKDVEVVDKTFQFFKGIEHGTVKEVTGKQIDETLEEVASYLKKIKQVFNQIEKKTEKTRAKEFFETTMKVVYDVLKTEDVKVEEHDHATIKKEFKKLVDKGLFPKQFLADFNAIAKIQEDVKKLRKMEIEKVMRESSGFFRAMVEYIQRKRGAELERAKIRIKYGDTFGEVFLLNDTAYMVDNIDAQEKTIQRANILPNGGLGDLRKSNLSELENALSTAQIPKKVFIKEKIFEDLRKLYGKDVEILVNY
jgi:uncharacterized protein (UPF0332 family)/predicted nucleotidyltransferase/ElaB/YqjD/DUF883 family membrane-anchored ribosome-binding protein